jgi:hypothetical protein
MTGRPWTESQSRDVGKKFGLERHRWQDGCVSEVTGPTHSA